MSDWKRIPGAELLGEIELAEGKGVLILPYKKNVGSQDSDSKITSKNTKYHTIRESKLKKFLPTVGLVAVLGFGAYSIIPSQAERNERIEREKVEENERIERENVEENERYKRENVERNERIERKKVEENERIKRENVKRKIEERNELVYTAWNYITPPKNEKRGYSLERGSRVEVLYDIKFERTVRMSQHSLIILFDEKIKFISNNRGKTRNFSKLTDLFLYEDKKWERFEWRNYEDWQKKYEDLVLEIYNVRKRTENSFGDFFEDRVNQNFKDKVNQKNPLKELGYGSTPKTNANSEDFQTSKKTLYRGYQKQMQIQKIFKQQQE